MRLLRNSKVDGRSGTPQGEVLLATCESDPKLPQAPSLLNQTTFTTDDYPWLIRG